jgi:hypothetical protein
MGIPMIPRGREQSRDSSLEERAAEIVLNINVSSKARFPRDNRSPVALPRLAQTRRRSLVGGSDRRLSASRAYKFAERGVI